MVKMHISNYRAILVAGIQADAFPKGIRAKSISIIKKVLSRTTASK